MGHGISAIRIGQGKPLLLIHGLGGSWRSWEPIIDVLADSREVIAIDLPGFGDSAPLDEKTSVNTLADAVTQFLIEENLLGIDAVGSSLGGRIVVELVRRGSVLGSAVALAPGGFWKGWQRHFFFFSIFFSRRFLLIVQPILGWLAAFRPTRALLLAQLSSRPTDIPADLAHEELRGYARSPVFESCLRELAYGRPQRGVTVHSILHPLLIVWGKQDRVCFPSEAKRARAFFPNADFQWLDDCGHFPHWDQPEKTARLILEHTSAEPLTNWNGLRVDVRGREVSDVRTYGPKESYASSQRLPDWYRGVVSS